MFHVKLLLYYWHGRNRNYPGRHHEAGCRCHRERGELLPPRGRRSRRCHPPPELLRACIPLNGCETGKAKITPGFRLPAKFVIHTPGPIYRDGSHGEPELLESCYRSCLELAEENACQTVAFPAISTGVYGYPWEAATEIAIRTVRNFPAQKVKKVIFCCFSPEMERIYRSAI